MMHQPGQGPNTGGPVRVDFGRRRADFAIDHLRPEGLPRPEI